MGALGYSLIYAISYAGLQLADAWLNHSRQQSAFSQELGQLGSPDNFSTLMFEPLNITILCLCSSMVFVMERNHQRVADLLRSDWAALLCTPFVLLAMKLLSVINSTLTYLGLNSPILVPGISDGDQMFFIILLFICVAAVLHFPVTRFLKKRYLPKG